MVVQVASRNSRHSRLVVPTAGRELRESRELTLEAPAW